MMYSRRTFPVAHQYVRRWTWSCFEHFVLLQLFDQVYSFHIHNYDNDDDDDDSDDDDGDDSDDDGDDSDDDDSDDDNDNDKCSSVNTK